MIGTGPSQVIRPAVIGDLAVLRSIAEAAYAIYISRIGKAPAPMDADYDCHVERAEIFVIEVDGAVAGFIVTYAKEKAQFIENVAIKPSLHGQGFGKLLLEFAETEARRKGFNRLFLYTNVQMTENLDFYPHLGYVETHRIREEGFERVYFEKRLQE